jgi:hypothetical protein
MGCALVTLPWRSSAFRQEAVGSGASRPTLLLHRSVSWAGRAAVMAAGACVASLAVTLGALVTALGQMPRF